MSLRAIFRFENLDSTKDLNDRFAGLFSKGIYEGGEVVSLVSPSYAVTINPFKALSKDGMAVISDSDITVALPSLSECFVILEAKYNIGSEPTLRLKAVTANAISNYEDCIKFAMVINGLVKTNGENYRDEISQVTRNHYRGMFTESTLPTNSSLIAGDWYFIKTANNYFRIAVWNGSFTSYFYSTTELNNSFVSHRGNIVENIGYQVDEKGYWAYPKKESSVFEGTESTGSINDDTYGSYHISVNKWFATESISVIWAKDEDEWTRTLNSCSTVENQLDLIETVDNKRGVRFESPSTAYSKSQKPTNNNKFITQDYPLLPTSDEKYALYGNLSDNAPDKDNRFVVQKTPAISFKRRVVSAVEPDDGYYYYPINVETESIYVGTAQDANYAVAYLDFDLNIDFSTAGISNLSSLSVVKFVKDSTSYVDIASSDFDGNFLKGDYSYFLKSNYPLKTSSLLKYYSKATIDSFLVPSLNSIIKSYEYVTSLRANNIRVNFAYINNGIDIGGNIEVTGTLAVDGIATFNSQIKVDTINAKSAGYISLSTSKVLGSFEVTGSSTLKELTATNTTINGTITVSGLATLDSVSLNSIIARSSSIALNSNTEVSGDFSVSGSTSLQSLTAYNTTINGNLTVSGTTTLTGQFNVTSLNASNSIASPSYNIGPNTTLSKDSDSIELRLGEGEILKVYGQYKDENNEWISYNMLNFLPNRVAGDLLWGDLELYCLRIIGFPTESDHTGTAPVYIGGDTNKGAIALSCFSERVNNRDRYDNYGYIYIEPNSTNTGYELMFYDGTKKYKIMLIDPED